jgi:hypothetical protein
MGWRAAGREVATMPTLHIEHGITDLARWRAAFDPLRDIRRRAGVVREQVRQPVGDPHGVVIDLDFATLDQAEAFLGFLQSSIWATPERSPALLGTPTATILDAVAGDGDGWMPRWITIVDWPGGRIETFAELQATHEDDGHGGLLARYLSQQPDGLRIVAAWESEAAARAFFEDLPAASRARLAPATDGTPSVTGLAIHHAWYRDR